MTGTRRKPRRAHDYYITPPWCVHRLLDTIDLGEGKLTVCDPAAGDGELRAAFESWDGELPPIDWQLNDIREEASVPLHFDYIRPPEGVVFDRCDLLIMNPPYIEALHFVKQALKHSREVYALLRLNWLASKRRREFLRVWPPDVFVIPNRPSFDGEGTDATEYAWFRWPNRRMGVTVLADTPVAVRKQQMKETRQKILEKSGQLALPHMEAAGE